LNSRHVGRGIIDTTDQREITTICIGKPRINLFKLITARSVFRYLLNQVSGKEDVDLIILS
jgi:two-component system sensor histidine kinase KdpD